MILEKKIAGILGVNCYIIGDEVTRKGAVIDPGGSIEDILKSIRENELSIEYIILTHSHGDHIGAVPQLKHITKAKIIAHIDEKELLNDKDKNLTSNLGCGIVEIDADEYVKDGQNIKLGNLSLEIIHTPGHTPGGMCIKVDNVMFSGDTLFSGSIGRTDLFGGDYSDIQNSLNKLSKLDDEITVFPGHGPATRLGIEKVTNPYMV
jgi:glyoxylase-like metal-dependent hydrolase (beta-lactamase superfamily II)